MMSPSAEERNRLALQESETATSTENLLSVELIIHDHYGRETRCVLHKLPAIIGRNEFADVPLVNPWVSHKHCEIDWVGDVLMVRDLGSRMEFSCTATG